MRKRVMPPRQQEIMIKLENGWFIIHSSFRYREYSLVQIKDKVRIEKPVHKSAVKALIQKGLVIRTDVHGNQARYNIKN